MIQHGYDIYTDEETGRQYTVSKSTGEVTPAINITAPVGTIFYTPEQQEAYKARKARKEAAEYTARATKGKKFYFTNRSSDYKDTEAADLTRLIYLAAYMAYDGYLYKYHMNKPIKKEDLPEVLKLSPSAVFGFWKRVQGRYITAEEDGRLKMQSQFFYKGKIRSSEQYQKFYRDAVKELYLKTPARQHKNLGAAFRLLHYVNIEYNVLCYNPEEEDLEKIRFMTWGDFCNINGYDVTHAARLKKVYKNLTMQTPKGEQVFCSVVTAFDDLAESKVFINPNVLYKGNNFKDVEILGEFCRKADPARHSENQPKSQQPQKSPVTPAFSKKPSSPF